MLYTKAKIKAFEKKNSDRTVSKGPPEWGDYFRNDLYIAQCFSQLLSLIVYFIIYIVYLYSNWEWWPHAAYYLLRILITKHPHINNKQNPKTRAELCSRIEWDFKILLHIIITTNYYHSSEKKEWNIIYSGLVCAQLS